MLLSWRAIAPHLVRQALDHGATEVAKAVADAARLGAERANGVPSATAAALHCTALADHDAEAGRRCIDEYRRSGRPFSLAVACVSVALMLEEEGDRPAALHTAREAVEVFTALRATYWVARAGRVLHRLTPSSTASPVPAGWETLTESERQVARLVARGLTNPEIATELVVSPRTVQAHTSRIYAKLGISSRAQLAGLVRETRA
jgi:DNA-binding CsgD family transcriptional regulator